MLDCSTALLPIELEEITRVPVRLSESELAINNASPSIFRGTCVSQKVFMEQHHQSGRAYVLAHLTHSISSSARARSSGETVILSAFAVLRLMQKTKLAGCSIGSVPGSAPFRILSTK